MAHKFEVSVDFGNEGYVKLVNLPELIKIIVDNYKSAKITVQQNKSHY